MQLSRPSVMFFWKAICLFLIPFYSLLTRAKWMKLRIASLIPVSSQKPAFAIIGITWQNIVFLIEKSNEHSTKGVLKLNLLQINTQFKDRKYLY